MKPTNQPPTRSFLKNFNCVFIITIAFLFLHSSDMFAQNLLISESTTSTLSSSQQAQYNRIVAKDMHVSHTLINYETLSSNQDSGRIYIHVPQITCDTIMFQVKDVEYSSESDYAWYGELKSVGVDTLAPCQTGDLTLVSSAYGKIGYMTLDSFSFEIADLGNDLFLLSLLDTLSGTECAHTTHIDSLPLNNNSNSSQNINEVEARSFTAPCVVRCLVLYTDNAVAEAGSLNNLKKTILLAQQQMQNALLNSDIRKNEYAIQFVGMELLVDFVESDDIEDDRDRIGTDGGDALIDAYDADIAIMITAGEDYAFQGISAIFPEIDGPYAIANIYAAATNYTFSHELGHFFGAGHHNDPRPGIPHGHQFHKNLINRSTLLGRGSIWFGKSSRILHFSNPDVKYKNKETGIAGTNNNALQIKNEFCNVADLNVTDYEPRVVIRGNNYYCPCAYNTLNVEVAQFNSEITYTFQWRISEDGINWTNLGSGSTKAIQMPCEVGKTYFIRVLATGSDQSTTVGNYSTQSALTWPGQEGVCILQKLSDDNNSAMFSIDVFPNPSGTEQNVSIQINRDNKYSLLVYDVEGRRIKTLFENRQLKPGVHSFQLNLPSNGLYIIQCLDADGNYISKKVIKL